MSASLAIASFPSSATPTRPMPRRYGAMTAQSPRKSAQLSQSEAQFSDARAEFIFGPVHGFMMLLNPVIVGIR